MFLKKIEIEISIPVQKLKPRVCRTLQHQIRIETIGDINSVPAITKKNYIYCQLILNIKRYYYYE